MKKIYIILIALFLINGAMAQWTWQNPLPQGNTLMSVYFTNANTGYIVGVCGTILKTINGGTNWTISASGTTNDLRSVFFTDPSTGYVVGLGGIILKTTNGGDVWVALSSGTTNHLYSVYFADPNTGYAVGDSGIILKTIDGGANWSAESAEQPLTYYPCALLMPIQVMQWAMEVLF